MPILLARPDCEPRRIGKYPDMARPLLLAGASPRCWSLGLPQALPMHIRLASDHGGRCTCQGGTILWSRQRYLPRTDIDATKREFHLRNFRRDIQFRNMTNKRKSSLVLVGHGSTLNPDSSAPTFQHADEIVRRGLFAEVYCSFWKEEPSLREVLRMVEGDDIYVVPNFISEGYFTEIVIPRELELVGPVTHRSGKIIKYCEPVGNDPRMIDLLLHRAHEAAPNVPPEKTSLLIVGHGTSLSEKSAEAAQSPGQGNQGKRVIC